MILNNRMNSFIPVRCQFILGVVCGMWAQYRPVIVDSRPDQINLLRASTETHVRTHIARHLSQTDSFSVVAKFSNRSLEFDSGTLNFVLNLVERECYCKLHKRDISCSKPVQISEAINISQLFLGFVRKCSVKCQGDTCGLCQTDAPADAFPNTCHSCLCRPRCRRCRLRLPYSPSPGGGRAPGPAPAQVRDGGTWRPSGVQSTLYPV